MRPVLFMVVALIVGCGGGDAGKPAPVAAPVDPVVSASQEPKPAEAGALPSEITNSLGMELLLIPAGEFLMGSDETKEQLEAAGIAVPFEISDESPRHRVRLTQDFYLGKTEVTRGQFATFVRASGYQTEAETDGKGGWGLVSPEKGWARRPEYTWQNTGFTQTDNHPVVNVSWNDAVALYNWLSIEESDTYQQSVTYRLPTEAEWEYACRGGTTTRYFTGDDPVSLSGFANAQDAAFEEEFPIGNYAKFPSFSFDDGSPFTCVVGRYKANAFGLHDMHGNVWEWCEDWHSSYPGDTTTDPHGPSTGSHCVFRGGCWVSAPANGRSADRYGGTPDYRHLNLGFRLARSSSE